MKNDLQQHPSPACGASGGRSPPSSRRHIPGRFPLTRHARRSALISGVGLGSMYGLIALGFHVTWAVSGTVNFAQGSAMMLGAVLSFTFG